MKKRVLGQSGIEITEIGLGTNYVGGHNLYENVDEAEGVRIVQRAVDLGITFIDTADIYGFGRSEELVGKALGDRKYDVIVATKGAVMFEGGKRLGFNNEPAYLRKALEASLKRLNRDYVDLYYIHYPDGKTPPEEACGVLMQFKEEGLIRAVGVSNFEMPELQAAVKAGSVDALQSKYSLLQRGVESEIIPFCKANTVSFIPYGPLAYGVLGGKYTKESKLSENDWRHRSGVFDPDVFERNIDIADKIKKIAGQKGVAPAHIAIQWILNNSAVGSVIAGAKRIDQLEQNAKADQVVLTEEELESIDSI